MNNLKNIKVNNYLNIFCYYNKYFFILSKYYFFPIFNFSTFLFYFILFYVDL